MLDIALSLRATIPFFLVLLEVPFFFHLGFQCPSPENNHVGPMCFLGYLLGLNL